MQYKQQTEVLNKSIRDAKVSFLSQLVGNVTFYKFYVATEEEYFNVPHELTQSRITHSSSDCHDEFSAAVQKMLAFSSNDVYFTVEVPTLDGNGELDPTVSPNHGAIAFAMQLRQVLLSHALKSFSSSLSEAKKKMQLNGSSSLGANDSQPGANSSLISESLAKISSCLEMVADVVKSIVSLTDQVAIFAELHMNSNADDPKSVARKKDAESKKKTLVNAIYTNTNACLDALICVSSLIQPKQITNEVR
jgi:hypothetical protein